MSVHREVRLLAEAQYSVVAVWQLGNLGVSKQAVHRWTGGPDWERLTPTVLRLVGSPATPEQEAFAAVLDAGVGSVLSLQAGAAWWAYPGYDLADLHVSRLRDGAGERSRLATLHFPRSLPPDHVTVFRGMPVTTPARTICDLAAVVNPAKLERTLENGWRRGLYTGRTLHRVHQDLAGRGRPGTSVMRELLAERPVDYQPTGSNLELRVQEILKRNGYHHFERQVNLGNEEEWLGRTDFYDRGRKVILEVHSEFIHGALIDRKADAARRAALIAAGFRFAVVWDTDVFHRPWKILEAIRQAERS